MASSDFGRMLSVGAIGFEDRFCASKKGRIGGGGLVSAWSAVHMATALVSCPKALVGTGWTISHLVNTTGSGTTPLSPCRGTISGLVGSILSGEACAGQTALTIESSLMSGCGYGHEPKKIV